MRNFTLRKGFLESKCEPRSSFKGFVMLVVMMLMTASTAMAEVIDGLRYVLDSETKTATLLPKVGGYSGDIVVPEKVKGSDGAVYSVVAFVDKSFSDCSGLTSISIPSSVTSLGDNCFARCSNLSSITIPSSVTSISWNCFESCSSLTTITIPSSVESFGVNCFNNCRNLENFYFKGSLPNGLKGASIPMTCIIYVPTEFLQEYEGVLGASYEYYTWNPDESGDDTKPVTQCATPSISYESGELKFASETAGAEYHYTITDADMASNAYNKEGKVSLSAAYKISVYATADGYTASDKAEATLYWINANLENGTNINQVRIRGVVASAHDGIISLSGLDDGEVVKFFAADGKYLGSTVAANGAASYAVSESLVIAKVGKDSIKIAMK